MKKLKSLLKACMTSDMSLFKVKTNQKKGSGKTLVIVLVLYLMFMTWGFTNTLCEELSPMHLEFIVLPLFVFITSIMTFIEGIYKTSSLMFNCKDDQLLLSLPIERRTVLFIRIFKFYVFELAFNTIFLLPAMVAYIRYLEHVTISYFVSSIVMLLLLPIIPIVLSCIVGSITSSLSSKFKYKNTAQTILSMVFLVIVLSMSFSTNSSFDYVIENATSINDIITGIYYPAGIYLKLVIDFNIIDLLLFIIIHIAIFAIAVFILGKFYFKINSKVNNISHNKKVNVNNLTIKSNNITVSLVKKELNNFFRTPVFIVNAGFSLVLFILMTIAVLFKFDSIVNELNNAEGAELFSIIIDNKSILILILVIVTAFMTSVTSSIISLEGKNINILKSLPVKVKTILMSKIYFSLTLTTPVLLIGELALFIKFKTSIVDSILLIIIAILAPLVSHFIGLLVNLKYPKLDAKNSTEVVKQSTSSMISVLGGVAMLMLNVGLIIGLVGTINTTLLLFIHIILYLVLDIILYMLLINKGVKRFNDLSI